MTATAESRRIRLTLTSPPREDFLQKTMSTATRAFNVITVTDALIPQLQYEWEKNVGTMSLAALGVKGGAKMKMAERCASLAQVLMTTTKSKVDQLKIKRSDDAVERWLLRALGHKAVPASSASPRHVARGAHRARHV